MSTSKSVSEEELQIIMKVAKRLMNKFKFGYFTAEDIFQQGVLIGIEALPNYNGKHPLENFMARHISNRLQNFKRKNYYRLGQSEKNKQARLNLMHPVDIDGMDEYFPLLDNMADRLSYDEMIDCINEKLSPVLRNDFLRMMARENISMARKNKVREAISEIIERFYDEEETGI